MHDQHTRTLVMPVLLVGISLVLFTAPAFGGLCLWSGLGDDDRFDNVLNWSPDPVPGASDRAVFDVAGSHDVFFPQDEASVDLFTLGGSIMFRSDPESDARHHYALGGDVFIENSTLAVAGLDLLVSNHVLVDAGGTLNVGFDDVGGFGRGHVDVGNALAVGSFEAGSVALSGGGTLLSTHAYLAQWPGSVASIRIDDVGSTFITGTDTILGDFGAGLLEVRGGGLAIFGSGLGIAKQPGSLGTAIVDGPGSSLFIWEDLAVGVDGDAMIVVSDGAELVSGSTDVGVFEGAGTVLVHGLDARWSAGVQTNIGAHGFGTVAVSGGGMIEMAHARVGDDEGAIGSALAVATGTRWELSDALWVGRRGTGSMSILDGAAVTSVYGSIGREAPGIGDVTVLGTGSRWEIDQSLAIGGAPSAEGGTGLLSVLGNGEVEVGTTMRIWSDGTVVLSGGKLTATHIDHSRSGTFSFTGGTLHTELFEGNLWNDGGTLAPGRSVGQSDLDSLESMNPAVLTGQTEVDGWYVQTHGTLEIDLLGDAARRNDQLVVHDSAYLSGALVIRLIAGYEPEALDEFVILAADDLVGSFENAAVTARVEGGGTFDVVYDRTPGAAQIRVTGYSPPRSCATDFNDDGMSGFRDLQMALAAWGDCTSCPFDLDADGTVGMPDLAIVMNAWGACP